MIAQKFQGGTANSKVRKSKKGRAQYHFKNKNAIHGVANFIALSIVTFKIKVCNMHTLGHVWPLSFFFTFVRMFLCQVFITYLHAPTMSNTLIPLHNYS